MTSRNQNNPYNRKTQEFENNNSNFPRKIFKNLVSNKSKNEKKSNLHLVSSTPMNPLRKAQFFDESNLIGSPIRSRSTETNNSGTDKEIKTHKTEINNKEAMLTNKEDSIVSSPFPYLTKLHVKRMTICVSEEDSDDNIFLKPKSLIKNTKLKAIENEKNLNKDLNPIKKFQENEDSESISSSSDSDIFVKSKLLKKHTKLRTLEDKMNSDEELNPIINFEENKRKGKSKSSENDKENLNVNKSVITSKKTKIQSTKKDFTEEETDTIERPVSPKYSNKKRKLQENTVRKKTINTKEIPESTISNTAVERNKNSSIMSDTRVRKSSRACQQTLPYWISPWTSKANLLEDVNDEVKGSRSKEIIDRTTKSAKDNKRTTTESGKREKKQEILNRSNAVSLKKGGKSNIPQIDEIVTVNPKINKKEKVTPENISKTHTINTPSKHGLHFELIEKRQYTKEILNNENIEKKMKNENKASKLMTSSRYKSMSPLTFESDSFDETHSQEENTQSNTIVNSDLGEENYQSSSRITANNEIAELSKYNQDRDNIIEMIKPTFEVFNATASSKKSTEKKNNVQENFELIRKQNDIITTIPKKKSANSKTNEEEKYSSKDNRETKNKTHTRSFKSKKLLKDSKKNLFKSNTESKETTDSIEPTTNIISETVISQLSSSPNIKKRIVEKNKAIKKTNKSTLTTPGLNRKPISKKTKLVNKAKNKQVNFASNYIDSNNVFESDSLSSLEDRHLPSSSKVNVRSQRNVNTFNGRKSETKFLRKPFYQPYTPRYTRSTSQNINCSETTENEISETFSTDPMDLPSMKKRKHDTKSSSVYKRQKVDHTCSLNFKEKALAVQVPMIRRTITEIEHRGRRLRMECFGNFPKNMTRFNDQCSLRGTCFINDLFAAGVMEIELGTVKKCNASNNHTYFVILDGIAEIGIGNSSKILRIGDCCIVPKSTFYYIANASSETNLLLNFLKITI